MKHLALLLALTFSGAALAEVCETETCVTVETSYYGDCNQPNDLLLQDALEVLEEQARVKCASDVAATGDLKSDVEVLSQGVTSGACIAKVATMTGTYRCL